MPERVGRLIYSGSVLFASLLWTGCVIGSLLGLALGDSLEGPLIAMLASFGLLVAVMGRAICLALGGPLVLLNRDILAADACKETRPALRGSGRSKKLDHLTIRRFQQDGPSHRHYGRSGT